MDTENQTKEQPSVIDYFGIDSSYDLDFDLGLGMDLNFNVPKVKVW